MKKRTFIYWVAAIICGTMFSSYNAGPGSQGWDCTGAETGLNNPTGCSAGNGCHSSSANTGIAVSVELDSVGVPTTHYKAGMTYTLKLTGTNNTISNLPKFGFQLGCIKGSAAAVTPVPTGSWVSPTPTGTHLAAPQAQNFVVPMLEQTTALAPTSGTGGVGTIYSKTFTWTAPVSGTGTISMWAVLNAVNGNNNNDAGDLWNTTHLVINEWPANTGISSIGENNMRIKIFPIPAQNNLNFSYTLNQSSSVTIQLFDLQGKVVTTLLNEDQTAGEKNLNVPFLDNLRNGIYFVKVIIDDKQLLNKIVISR
ncbi:MAG: T9SS type A sorting domain-containing protein [Bacteroidota bacterium]